VSDEYKKWQTLGKHRDLESWEMFPSTVNAYFNPPANEVRRRLAYYQVILTFYQRSSSLLRYCNPRFSCKTGMSHRHCSILSLIGHPRYRPTYVSFGSFGHIAAHELTVNHCFSHICHTLTKISICSTLSIQLVDFIIKTASLRSGGRMPLVKVSMYVRNVSEISTPVSTAPFGQ
jgi:hypothetical protein